MTKPNRGERDQTRFDTDTPPGKSKRLPGDWAKWESARKLHERTQAHVEAMRTWPRGKGMTPGPFPEPKPSADEVRNAEDEAAMEHTNTFKRKAYD